ncbi:hypothetical protein Sme01_47460 [Sphaerisporangium melleum]|uniref:Uncharacterized protein n=1 Tax=Sphaerisporangium melleum TaxID=321316 RepID=A0A917VW05_9ACTN|nr:hypothetical protein GCM10007964_71990 [Sphaerisporangium melleum]GII72270.1 hypothetical protein Sme01_47460 [Sphaerisporangium melleum]
MPEEMAGLRDAAAYAMPRHILRSGERFRRLFGEAKDADGMAVKA